ILEAPGNDSRYARVIKWANSADFIRSKSVMKSILSSAYELEFSPSKIKPPEADMSYPTALSEVFTKDHLYKDAFERLTHGKQRGYLIYFRQAKQESTCKRRIESCREKVLKGEAR
ncbi:MAG: YdeI/OmpD-associated family protein, partial [Flavobacteriales bacterium]